MACRLIWAASAAAMLALAGCNTPMNDPDRFMGRLPPDILARIEPDPLPNPCPSCPMLKGADNSHAYIPSSYGAPVYGTWSGGHAR